MSEGLGWLGVIHDQFAKITPLELWANVVTAVSILLAGRNSLHTWWTGIIGCLLFAWLFHGVQLYADALLQMFFLATSIAGWWAWQRGAQGATLPITRTDRRTLLWAVPGGVAATAAYGEMLFRFTNAYAPHVDSAVLVFSVIAQFLLMRRKLESWAFWLLVNTLSVPLFASRELYLTSALYTAYWVNAVVSWLWWRRLMRAGPVE